MASSRWRAQGVRPDHIAALLRNPPDLPPGPGADCYLTRQDMGEDLPCQVSRPVSLTLSWAVFAASPPIPVLRRWVEWDDGWQVIRTDTVYTFRPLQFLYGNPRVADMLQRDVRYINGYLAYPYYVHTLNYISPCAYYPDNSQTYVEPSVWDYLFDAIRDHDGELPPVIIPHEHQTDWVLGDVPIPFLRREWHASTPYVYYWWFATPLYQPRWLQIWVYSGALQRGPAAPAVPADQPDDDIVEIDLAIGVRVPEPLPPVPLPQTGGAIGVRALGARVQGVALNGHWYVKGDLTAEFDLALKKWGLGADYSTERYIEIWGSPDGVTYYQIGEYSEAQLSVGPIRLQIPAQELIYFRWRSDEPFPLMDEAKLILRLIPGSVVP